ncbi:lamin tail domain-containing protein [Flavihumibacter sp. ZG627]|uniref:lamin tail domain-containing protein n=1 Tax=Flavihumibacter sp. ZG627 TaxID=1463156 RepID=UPI00057F6418|nr:lamin tail domain-containing protein [Flavihumibacter sp. ZG627]KIC91224.1 hypothetical protein HY58_09510 [Flavihumibacter sp. ZG627]
MFGKSIIALFILCTQTLYGQGLKVVITEIMADPVPAVALPPKEYIELTNISGERIDLSGWRLGTGHNPAIIEDGVILEKDSIIIICSKESVSHLQVYGRVWGIERFPILLNDSDTLFLYDRDSAIHHAVSYNPIIMPANKRDGGWSLELVDLKAACSIQSNWIASNNPLGGSPGIPNNSQISIPDSKHFSLLHAYTLDSMHIILVFNDAVDTASARLSERYFLEPPITINNVVPLSPLYNLIRIELNDAMEPGKIYNITARDLQNCLQQPLSTFNQTKTGIPQTHPENIIINEIMNDPPSGGSDYFEIYNNGNKIIDLNYLLVGNRNSRAEISSVKPLGESTRYLFPGDHMAFTTDLAWVGKQYHLKAPSQVVLIADLPSWPNETGNIVLLDTAMQVIDELKYHENWHSELVRIKDGVSLEKIDPRAETQDKNNWHSAAIHSGYGTPGYQNSQHLNYQIHDDKIWAEPSLFSPDGDGIEEECKIKYRFQEAGTVATVRIFNRNGQLLRQLANNALCGREGNYSWDGRDDKGKISGPGIYIISTDVFHLTGKTKRYRFAVTLANKNF